MRLADHPDNEDVQFLQMLKNLTLPSSLSSWLLAASLAFAPLTSLRVPGFAHLSYCDILFVMAPVAGIVERFMFRDFVYNKSLFIAVLAYISCLLALSVSYVINHASPTFVLWSEKHGLGYDTNFFVLILNTVLVPLALFAVRIRSLAEYRFIILAWTVSALYGAIFVIAYCKGYISHYDWYWIHTGRASGLTPSPNALGVNIVLALPGLLLFWCVVHDRLLRFFIMLGMVVIWEGANYTGSRTSIGALIAILVVFLIMRSRNRVRGLCIGAAALPVVLLLRELIVAFAGDLLTRTSALGRLILGTNTADSNTIRHSLNSLAYQQWTDNPIFGVGYGMLRVAHNLYIQMLDVAGVVGFLPYIGVLGMPLLFLLINRTHEYARNEVAAISAAMGGVLTIAWIQPAISDYNSSVVFGLALYLALNANFHPMLRSGAEARQGSSSGGNQLDRPGLSGDGM